MRQKSFTRGIQRSYSHASIDPVRSELVPALGRRCVLCVLEDATVPAAAEVTNGRFRNPITPALSMTDMGAERPRRGPGSSSAQAPHRFAATPKYFRCWGQSRPRSQEMFVTFRAQKMHAGNKRDAR